MARKQRPETIRRAMLAAGWVCEVSTDARGRLRRWWSEDGKLSWRKEKDAVAKFLAKKENQ